MKQDDIRSVKRWLIFFMVALFISGATAMPIETELKWAVAVLPEGTWAGEWLRRVQDGFNHALEPYPFLQYGYDWLAFAHFVLAVLFIGPYKDPVRNIWIIQFGLIACVLILPFAFIVGTVRGIPFWWQLIDCSFGVVGFAVLWGVYIKIKRLERNTKIRSYE